jgi:hypothetical protein
MGHGSGFAATLPIEKVLKTLCGSREATRAARQFRHGKM